MARLTHRESAVIEAAMEYADAVRGKFPALQDLVRLRGRLCDACTALVIQRAAESTGE